MTWMAGFMLVVCLRSGDYAQPAMSRAMSGVKRPEIGAKPSTSHATHTTRPILRLAIGSIVCAFLQFIALECPNVVSVNTKDRSFTTVVIPTRPPLPGPTRYQTIT